MVGVLRLGGRNIEAIAPDFSRQHVGRWRCAKDCWRMARTRRPALARVREAGVWR